MKLFAKYSRINVIATVMIFIIASIAFYFTLQYVFINQIDEDLRIEEKEIETYVREHDRLPESISVNDQFIAYQPAKTQVARSVFTIQMLAPGQQHKERFRQLVFGINAASQLYEVTVSKSLEETENLTRSVLIIAFATILLILLVTFFINRVVLKRIWKPFYRSLDAVKEFEVRDKKPLKLGATAIDEFQIMNETIEKITNRAQLDYLSLKTFSENASHEIQTPLAVLRSKLDLIVQDEGLTEKQGESLQAAYNSVQKLTRLNHSLLLLAKIENNQFYDVKPVDFKSKVEEKIADFQELWLARELDVETHLENVTVAINEELIDILLNNLLGNATRHNYKGGRIRIALREHLFSIANTSDLSALDVNTLYRRFTKNRGHNDNNGLGLSIVRQICDNTRMKIHYEFKDEMHVFIIEWNGLKTLLKDKN